jgi:hypothetical protein
VKTAVFQAQIRRFSGASAAVFRASETVYRAHAESGKRLENPDFQPFSRPLTF